jgi:hypothetical protein
MSGAALADKHVQAAFDHLAGAAAVHVGISHAVSRLLINQHRLAAFDGHPCIGTAPVRMHAGVADAQGGPPGEEYVGRAFQGGARRHVPATGLAVRIRRNRRSISHSRLRLHDRQSNTMRQ